MKKRNGFDAGRFSAAVVAVILIMIIPLRNMIDYNIGGTGKKITSILDGFTVSAQNNTAIRVNEYENLVSYLNFMGLSFSLDIEIEREVFSLIAGKVEETKVPDPESGAVGAAVTGTDDMITFSDNPYGYGDDIENIYHDLTERPFEITEGRYIYIPHDVILSELYQNGVYSMKQGDILSIKLKINDNSMLRRIASRFLIADPLKEEYSSGIVI